MKDKTISDGDAEGAEVMLVCDCASHTLPVLDLEKFFQNSHDTISCIDGIESVPSSESPVLIVTTDPISALAILLVQTAHPTDAVEKWVQWAHVFVKAHKTLRRRSTVIFIQTLLDGNEVDIGAIEERLNVAITGRFEPNEKNRLETPITKVIAAELLRQSPEAMMLAETIISSAIGGVGLDVLPTTILAAWEAHEVSEVGRTENEKSLYAKERAVEDLERQIGQKEAEKSKLNDEMKKCKARTAELEGFDKQGRGELDRAQKENIEIKKKIENLQRDFSSMQESWEMERSLLRENVSLHLDIGETAKAEQNKQAARLQQEVRNLKEEVERYHSIASDAQAERSRLLEVHVTNASLSVSPTMIVSSQEEWFSSIMDYLKRISSDTGGAAITAQTIADCFDIEYYFEQRPDVVEAGMNAILHYVHHGGVEGFDPSPFFSSAWYLAENVDVADAGINPLVHYLLLGQNEQRQPHKHAAPGECVAIHARQLTLLKDEISHLDRALNTLLQENGKLETRLNEVLWQTKSS